MRLFLWVLLMIFTFSIVPTEVFSAPPNDWLRDVYRLSHNPPWWWTGDPYSSEIEAHQMFNSRLWFNIWWPESWSWVRDSVFVRFARFLMRIGVMLSIPILLFGAIKVMLSLWDTWKLIESLKLVWKLILWLLLFLSSVMIIFILTSLTRSALPDI